MQMMDKKQAQTSEKIKSEEIVLKGTTICPGVGIGKAHIVREDINIPRCKIADDQVGREQKRYKQAVKLITKNLHEHIEE